MILDYADRVRLAKAHLETLFDQRIVTVDDIRAVAWCWSRNDTATLYGELALWAHGDREEAEEESGE